MNQDEARQIIEATEYWHYPFDLPWRTIIPTRASPERHHLRRAHILDPLVEHYRGSLSGKTILDLGCCQGFWSFEAARAGAAKCLGLDSSANFVREAEALSCMLGIGNCEFRCAHLENDPWWEGLKPRHVTFFLGLFYHLADPVFVLRKAMESTLDVLIIDTDITNDKKAVLTIMPRDALEPTTRGSNLTSSIRIVPSLPALRELLLDGGFKHVQVLKPAASMPREYHKKQRASIIAYR